MQNPNAKLKSCSPASVSEIGTQRSKDIKVSEFDMGKFISNSIDISFIAD